MADLHRRWVRTPERMDDPFRPIRYRIYRDHSYEPSNVEARFLCDRIRELEIARDQAEAERDELIEQATTGTAASAE